MTAVIIDDEEMGRLSLRKKINMYCDSVDVVGEAENGEAGIKLIAEKNPDIVFLDIEMPVMNGFEMMGKLLEPNFHLIFVTAYDQYAIKAIRYAAFDYLLKPVDIDQLKQALARINSKETKQTKRQLQTLQEQLNMVYPLGKIAVPTIDGLLFFNTKDIIHLEAEGNYTTLYMVDDKKQVTSRSLKDFEELLPSAFFFRCHHSHMISLQFISRYIKGDGGQIELENGQTVPVSRRKKEAFLEKVKNL